MPLSDFVNIKILHFNNFFLIHYLQFKTFFLISKYKNKPPLVITSESSLQRSSVVTQNKTPLVTTLQRCNGQISESSLQRSSIATQNKTPLVTTLQRCNAKQNPPRYNAPAL